MRLKKITAMLLAGVIMTSSAPVVWAADYHTASEGILSEEQEAEISDALDTYGEDIADLAGSPEKLGQILAFVKDTLDSVDVSDEQILSVIDEASLQFGISFTEEQKAQVLRLYKAVKNLDIDGEQIAGTIQSVYDKLGVSNEDVKGFVRKVIDWVKSILG